MNIGGLDKVGLAANQGKKVYEPIPKNDYLVRMTKVSEKETKKKISGEASKGLYVDATFEVLEGDHKGRLVFQKFIISHDNPKVESIGMQQLDRFLKAAGINAGFEGIGNDTTQLEGLLNTPVLGKVAIEEGSNGYPARNKITSFNVR